MEPVKSERVHEQVLYKIVSMENWEASQGKENLILSTDDMAFIHFSTQDQLDRILCKYWASVPEYVILKVDVCKLPGRMVFEPNSTGCNKYYHLYDGTIPLSAICEVKVCKS